MDKQQSNHIGETTSCSGKRNKCYNSITHKRAKSNCVNSYNGVYSSGTNMNVNKSGNVKTVVFGPGALNSKEQVINVAYKFDSRKQHMMSQDNNNNNSCLKIFINFMDINKDSNNKSVNNNNNVIKCYNSGIVNGNRNNVSSNNNNKVDGKRSTSLYSKPIKITRSSILNKLNHVNKSPEYKKEQSFIMKNYKQNILKKLSMNNNNNNNSQSQSNTVIKHITSYKQSKTNNNNNNDNSADMNHIFSRSMSSSEYNIFNSNKKESKMNIKYNKLFTQTKVKKLTNSFRHYMNNNANKQIKKNININNDSEIKLYNRTKKTNINYENYYSEFNDNEMEIARRINLTPNSTRNCNSFKKNIIYSNLLNNNNNNNRQNILKVSNVINNNIRTNLNSTQTETKPKKGCTFNIKTQFHNNNNLNKHSYYSFISANNNSASKNNSIINHKGLNDKNFLINTNNSTPITTLGFNKEEIPNTNVISPYTNHSKRPNDMIFEMEDDNGNVIKVKQRVKKCKYNNYFKNNDANNNNNQVIIEYVDEDGNVVDVKDFKNMKKVTIESKGNNTRRNNNELIEKEEEVNNRDQFTQMRNDNINEHSNEYNRGNNYKKDEKHSEYNIKSDDRNDDNDIVKYIDENNNTNNNNDNDMNEIDETDKNEQNEYLFKNKPKPYLTKSHSQSSFPEKQFQTISHHPNPSLSDQLQSTLVQSQSSFNHPFSSSMQLQSSSKLFNPLTLVTQQESTLEIISSTQLPSSSREQPPLTTNINQSQSPQNANTNIKCFSTNKPTHNTLLNTSHKHIRSKLKPQSNRTIHTRYSVAKQHIKSKSSSHYTNSISYPNKTSLRSSFPLFSYESIQQQQQQPPINKHILLSSKLNNNNNLSLNQLKHRLSYDETLEQLNNITQSQELFYLKQTQINLIQPPNAMSADLIDFFK